MGGVRVGYACCLPLLPTAFSPPCSLFPVPCSLLPHHTKNVAHTFLSREVQTTFLNLYLSYDDLQASTGHGSIEVNRDN